MENILITFFEKTPLPACIAFIGYLLYKVYIFKNIRYNGSNPQKCPNCKEKSCKLNFTDSNEAKGIAIEHWVCSHCKKDIHYIIH